MKAWGQREEEFDKGKRIKLWKKGSEDVNVCCGGRGGGRKKRRWVEKIRILKKLGK